MRKLLLLYMFLLPISTFSQFSCPKGFHLVPGENLSGADDEYTNGACSFDTHKIFIDYSYHGNDDSVKKYMSDIFGFPFHLTKDGVCWGTGKRLGFYSYIIVTGEAEVIELYSKNNDSSFSYYSKWLLSTAREYKKAGKSMIFPMRIK